jgi:hypothetical protein
MERTIEASRTVHASVDAVSRLLTGPESVLGRRQPRTGRAQSSYRADLQVELGGGSSVRERVTIHCARQLGSPEHHVRWHIAWEPVGSARVLPSFRGELEATEAGEDTVLRLVGRYRPPLGALGAAGDMLIGHRVARRTLECLLAGIAERIDSRSGLGERSPAHHADPITKRRSGSSGRSTARRGC